MRASAQELAVELDVGDIHTRGEDWGGQVVRHIELPAGADLRPLLRGLPDDRCACPHWGYVLAGSINVQYADGTIDVNRAGDLYYWPGGHTGWTDEGVTFIEISPAEEIRPVLEHLGAQLAPS
ncbi:MAG: cupin domain-containing protein [Acidimicrobiales bacterium]